MAYIWQRWIADELRAAGGRVIEVEGWKNRGRPASTGAFDPDDGVTNHHTGTKTSSSSTHPTLSLLIRGRSDLPGPLAQVSVAYDGTIYVLAAGRANHAGKVGKSIYGLLGADGNAHFLGDEIDTNGTQPMPPAQRDAVALVNRVFTDHYRNDDSRIHRHQDISGTGKWDVGNLTTAQLRRDAANISKPNPEDDMPAYSDWPKKDRDALAKDVAAAVLGATIEHETPDPKVKPRQITVRKALEWMNLREQRIEDKLAGK